MLDAIRCALVWVRAVCALRPSCRHRAGMVPCAPRTALSRPMAPATGSATARTRPIPVRPYCESPTVELRLPLDGEMPALVRPYVAAHERRREQRQNSGPRVTAVCAPHGMVVVR